MRRCFAISLQTITAAFRLRALVTVLILLTICVAGLPLVIRHNGTARMFAEVMLTYNLSVIAVLLGFTTLWLACGTLAGEIETGLLQMVAVKPIARWQIWLGKWLGILIVDALLLGLASGAAIAVLFWRAHELPPEQQTVLRQEVLVARGSLREAPTDLEPDVERLYEQRRNDESVRGLDPQFVKQQLRAIAKARIEGVPPNYGRVWTMELGARRFFLRDKPLFLRVKFHAASGNSGVFNTVWIIGDVASGHFQRLPRSMPADAVQEFAISPNLYSSDGKLAIECQNRDATTLLFPLEEDLELLYPEGGFLLNYTRGAGIIFCWLALLAAVGLAASTFLSFPVAALLALTLLVVGLSGGMFSDVVQDGTYWGFDTDTGRPQSPVLDWFFVPIFRAASFIVNHVSPFSPIDALASGRSISWEQLGLAVAEIPVLAGGIFAAIGAVTLTRRQLGQSSNTS